MPADDHRTNGWRIQAREAIEKIPVQVDPPPRAQNLRLNSSNRVCLPRCSPWAPMSLCPVLKNILKIHFIYFHIPTLVSHCCSLLLYKTHTSLNILDPK